MSFRKRALEQIAVGSYGLKKGRNGMRDLPPITAAIKPERSGQGPIRAIVCITGSDEDCPDGRLELKPWPDATPEERAIIARIELAQVAWVGPPRELQKHFVTQENQ
jgi:hypothetical protein